MPPGLEDDGKRKSKKSPVQVGATSVESSPGVTQTGGENATAGKSESLFLPFAKPYGDYFEAVREAHRAFQQSATEIYTAYVKDAHYAIGARDAEALRSATEKYYAAWAELAKSSQLVATVNTAFEAYRRELMAALASGAMNDLGPGCLALVAYSIGVVASHQTGYQTSFGGL